MDYIQVQKERGKFESFYVNALHKSLHSVSRRIRALDVKEMY